MPPELRKNGAKDQHEKPPRTKTVVGKEILTSDASPQLKDFFPKCPDLLLGLAALLHEGLRLLGALKGRVPFHPQHTGRLELRKHLPKESGLLLKAIAQALKEGNNVTTLAKRKKS